MKIWGKKATKRLMFNVVCKDNEEPTYKHSYSPIFVSTCVSVYAY